MRSIGARTEIRIIFFLFLVDAQSQRTIEVVWGTYSLVLFYYYGAAITSSMRAPWMDQNAEDLEKRPRAVGRMKKG